MTDNPLLESYLTPAECAAELGIAARTLDRWHRLNEGPPRTYLGRRIFYRKEAVANWIAANEEAVGA